MTLEVLSLANYGTTEGIRTVLEEAIVNPFTKEIVREDVDEVFAKLEASLQGQDPTYYAVARMANAQAVGIMGLRAVGGTTTEDPMREYATAERAAEVVNAYSRVATRGQGVGTGLLHFLENHALVEGYQQIVLNSGPRFMLSGWPFWNAKYGKPVAVLKDFYGPSFDAKVWRHDLVTPTTKPL